MTVTHENGAAEPPTKKAAKKGGKAKQETELATEASSSAEPEAAATPEPPQEPEPTPKPRSRKTKRIEEGSTLTMGMLAERYLEHLGASGKSQGTSFSYSIELRTACKALGSDTLISALTVEDVRRYFACDAVMKLKSGRPKAMPSYLKTQRVLRLALCWAEERRWIEKAPIPEQGESK